jgi:uncharacterized protein with HEPN domain
VPSSDPAQRFEDILANIVRIEQQMEGIKDVTAFNESHLIYDAVQPCLERITEIPSQQIRGLRNVLRHEYDRVESIRVWYVVQDDLPPLKTAVKDVLRRFPENQTPR